MKRILLYALIFSTVIGQVGFAFPKRAFADNGDSLIIHATPPYPAAFQRVNLTLDTPKYKDGNVFKLESPNYSGLRINWFSNKTLIDVCQNDNSCSVMMGPAGNRWDPNNQNKFRIEAVWQGEHGLYTGGITVMPLLNDIGQRDNLTNSLDCTAQTLDALANDIDRTKNMVEDTLNQIDDMQQQLTEDLDFITSLLDVTKTLTQFEEDYNKLKDSIIAIGSTDGTAQSIIRASAKALRTAIDLYLAGNIAQKIAHFEKIKTRYENMRTTLTAMGDARLRYMRNMSDQLDRQRALCEQQWSKVNTHGL